jgi:hypothetical protein
VIDPSRSSLSASMMALLRRSVERHEPELLSLVDEMGGHPLDVTDREALRGAVLSEFLAAGTGGDDEPTAYGLELEALIDALGHC